MTKLTKTNDLTKSGHQVNGSPARKRNKVSTSHATSTAAKKRNLGVMKRFECGKWRRERSEKTEKKTKRASAEKKTKKQKLYYCPLCPNEPPYAGASGLWYHNKKHHGAATRPYKSRRCENQTIKRKNTKQDRKLGMSAKKQQKKSPTKQTSSKNKKAGNPKILSTPESQGKTKFNDNGTSSSSHIRGKKKSKGGNQSAIKKNRKLKRGRGNNKTRANDQGTTPNRALRTGGGFSSSHQGTYGTAYGTFSSLDQAAIDGNTVHGKENRIIFQEESKTCEFYPNGGISSVPRQALSPDSVFYMPTLIQQNHHQQSLYGGQQHQQSNPTQLSYASQNTFTTPPRGGHHSTRGQHSTSTALAHTSNSIHLPKMTPTTKSTNPNTHVHVKLMRKSSVAASNSSVGGCPPFHLGPSVLGPSSGFYNQSNIPRVLSPRKMKLLHDSGNNPVLLLALVALNSSY